MNSNKPYRIGGNRTEQEWVEQRTTGTQRQSNVMRRWFEIHREFTSANPSFPVKMDAFRLNDDGITHHGIFVDKDLDADIDFSILGKTKRAKIEIDCVEQGPFARFKEWKLEKNVKRNIPIVHFHGSIHKPVMYAFSPEVQRRWLDNLVSNDEHYSQKNPDGPYDGRLYHLFCAGSGEYNSVHFSLLINKPELVFDAYKALLKTIITGK